MENCGERQGPSKGGRGHAHRDGERPKEMDADRVEGTIEPKNDEIEESSRQISHSPLRRSKRLAMRREGGSFLVTALRARLSSEITVPDTYSDAMQ